jgi:hypothetical protein
MQTIDHSKYPAPRELRGLQALILANDTVYPPPYIMAGMRLQYAMDEGAGMALTENAILIKWSDGADGRGVMERLMFTEAENNYLIDLVTPALI